MTCGETTESLKRQLECGYLLLTSPCMIVNPRCNAAQQQHEGGRHLQHQLALVGQGHRWAGSKSCSPALPLTGCRYAIPANSPHKALVIAVHVRLSGQRARVPSMHPASYGRPVQPAPQPQPPEQHCQRTTESIGCLATRPCTLIITAHFRYTQARASSLQHYKLASHSEWQQHVRQKRRHASLLHEAKPRLVMQPTATPRLLAAALS